MKSIVLSREEASYYKRIHALLPLYMGLVFAVLVFVLYYLIMVAILDYEFKWYYIFIAFGFGFIDGLITVYINSKTNKKRTQYYSQLDNTKKNNLYIPVMMKKGMFTESKGALLLTKDSIEYQVYQMFEKRQEFELPKQEVEIEFETVKNNWLRKIFTLANFRQVVKLKTKDDELTFVIPSLNNVSHRIHTLKTK